MNQEMVGAVIRQLRTEKHMTQLDLADKIGLTDKAVSKWERGIGCPDISILMELAEIFGVSVESILCGELAKNKFVGGNMKKTKYYVCPVCGNLTICTGNAEIVCCGRKLEQLEAIKADGEDGLSAELVENDWYITTKHPMEKEHYISFIAFATGDKLEIIKQYPQWDMQTRLPMRAHGKLFWYCTLHGLFYKLI